jgi:hypothetical protein
VASPSYTYTLTNGTTADASQVMQNFNDILNGVSDGTKDLSVSALTAAGTTTLNGNVAIGNASGDDLTVTASLASTIPVKTTASYDIGSSTLGLRSVYLGRNSQTVRLIPHASMSATYSLTLPINGGTNGYVPQTDGSGNLAWIPVMTATSAKSGSYTVLDTDGIGTILVTTGASNRTITLPTASDNAGRMITVKKVDSGAGRITIAPEGSETVDGRTTGVLLFLQYESAQVVSDGSNWHVANASWASGTWSPTVSGLVNIGSNPTVAGARFIRNNANVLFSFNATIDPTTAATLWEFTLTPPIASNFTGATDAVGVGAGRDSQYTNATIEGNGTSDVLRIRGFMQSNNSVEYGFSGMYEIKL